MDGSKLERKCVEFYMGVWAGSSRFAATVDKWCDRKFYGHWGRLLALHISIVSKLVGALKEGGGELAVGRICSASSVDLIVVVFNDRLNLFLLSLADTHCRAEVHSRVKIELKWIFSLLCANLDALTSTRNMEKYFQVVTRSSLVAQLLMNIPSRHFELPEEPMKPKQVNPAADLLLPFQGHFSCTPMGVENYIAIIRETHPLKISRSSIPLLHHLLFFCSSQDAWESMVPPSQVVERLLFTVQASLVQPLLEFLASLHWFKVVAALANVVERVKDFYSQGAGIAFLENSPPQVPPLDLQMVDIGFLLRHMLALSIGIQRWIEIGDHRADVELQNSGLFFSVLIMSAALGLGDRNIHYWRHTSFSQDFNRRLISALQTATDDNLPEYIKHVLFRLQTTVVPPSSGSGWLDLKFSAQLRRQTTALLDEIYDDTKIRLEHQSKSIFQSRSAQARQLIELLMSSLEEVTAFRRKLKSDKRSYSMLMEDPKTLPEIKAAIILLTELMDIPIEHDHIHRVARLLALRLDALQMSEQSHSSRTSLFDHLKSTASASSSPDSSDLDSTTVLSCLWAEDEPRFFSQHIHCLLLLLSRLSNWSAGIGRNDSRSVRDLVCDLLEQLATVALPVPYCKLPLFASDAAYWIPRRGRLCPLLSRAELVVRRKRTISHLKEAIEKAGSLQAQEGFSTPTQRDRSNGEATISPENGFFTFTCHNVAAPQSDETSSASSPSSPVQSSSPVDSTTLAANFQNGVSNMEYTEKVRNPFGGVDFFQVDSLLSNDRGNPQVKVWGPFSSKSLEILYHELQDHERLLFMSRIAAGYNLSAEYASPLLIGWHFSHLCSLVLSDFESGLRFGLLTIRDSGVKEPFSALCNHVALTREILSTLEFITKSTFFSAMESLNSPLSLNTARRILTSLSRAMKTAVHLSIIVNQCYRLSHQFRQGATSHKARSLMEAGFDLIRLADTTILPYVVTKCLAGSGIRSSEELGRRALVLKSCEIGALGRLLRTTLMTWRIHADVDCRHTTSKRFRTQDNGSPSPRKLICMGGSLRSARPPNRTDTVENEPPDPLQTENVTEENWIEFESDHRQSSMIEPQQLENTSLPPCLSEYLQTMFRDKRMKHD